MDDLPITTALPSNSSPAPVKKRGRPKRPFKKPPALPSELTTLSSPVGHAAASPSPGPEGPRSQSADSTPVKVGRFTRQATRSLSKSESVPGGLSNGKDNGIDDGAVDSPAHRAPKRPRWAEESTLHSASSPSVLQSELKDDETPVKWRPDLRRKSKSEPVKVPSPIGTSIENKLRDVIASSLTKKQTKDKTVGSTYILAVVLEAVPDKCIHKVGQTKNPARIRVNQIQHSCEHRSTNELDDPDRVEMEQYERAETLMKEELKPFQYEFYCSRCDYKHTEYFEVDERTVRMVVRRWRAFCARKPYDDEGDLKGFWLDRLRAMKRLSGSDASSSEALARHWHWYTTASDMEWIWYDAMARRDKALRFRWHIIALCEAFVLMICNFPPEKSLVWFGFVFVWLGLEILFMQPPEKPVMRSRATRQRSIAQKELEDPFEDKDSQENLAPLSPMRNRDAEPSPGGDGPEETPDTIANNEGANNETERDDNEQTEVTHDGQTVEAVDVQGGEKDVARRRKRMDSTDGDDLFIRDGGKWTPV